MYVFVRMPFHLVTFENMRKLFLFEAKKFKINKCIFEANFVCLSPFIADKK